MMMRGRKRRKKKDEKQRRSCDDDEEEQLRQGTLTVRDLIPLLTVWRSLRIERAEGKRET